MRKIIGFLAFITTGIILLINTFNTLDNTINYFLLLGIAAFYFNGLINHFKELKEQEE